MLGSVTSLEPAPPSNMADVRSCGNTQVSKLFPLNKPYEMYQFFKKIDD